MAEVSVGNLKESSILLI